MRRLSITVIAVVAAAVLAALIFGGKPEEESQSGTSESTGRARIAPQPATPLFEKRPTLAARPKRSDSSAAPTPASSTNSTAPSQPKTPPMEESKVTPVEPVEVSGPSAWTQYPFIVGPLGKLEDFIAAAGGENGYINENFTHQEVIEPWREDVPTFPVPTIAVCVSFSGRPTTQEVITSMRAQGLRPATAVELFSFSAQWQGKTSLRVSAIGGEPAEIEHVLHFPFLEYQFDKDVYGEPKWVIGFGPAHPQGGWNGDKGWEHADPTDYFLAIKLN